MHKTSTIQIFLVTMLKSSNLFHTVHLKYYHFNIQYEIIITGIFDVLFLLLNPQNLNTQQPHVANDDHTAESYMESTPEMGRSRRRPVRSE